MSSQCDNIFYSVSAHKKNNNKKTKTAQGFREALSTLACLKPLLDFNSGGKWEQVKMMTRDGRTCPHLAAASVSTASMIACLAIRNVWKTLLDINDEMAKLFFESLFRNMNSAHFMTLHPIIVEIWIRGVHIIF